MSNATVLQAAANRYSRVAAFAPISVDGNIGPNTLNAVQRALTYLSVESDGSDSGWVTNSVSEDAAEWASKADTTLRLSAYALQVGAFLAQQADKLNLPAIAGPTSSTSPIPASPIITMPATAAGLIDRFKILPAWQKILLGALAGFGVIWLWGRVKKSRGLAGLSGAHRLYLYTYRNRHGSYTDLWARDAEHAHEQIRRRKDRPTTMYTLSRVTNVPAREVA